MIDAPRYWLGLALLVSLPAALLFWVLGHGLVELWRRLGLVATYSLLTVAMALVGGVVWGFREPLMAWDLGLRPWLFLPAFLLVAVALGVEIRCREVLATSTMLGVPELAPERMDQPLLTQGIYAWVRHPRYLAAMLGFAGASLFVQYGSVYLAVPVAVAGLDLVARLEDRELANRYGDAFRRYSEEVPRLIPRLRGRS